jgi:hypothetical protein
MPRRVREMEIQEISAKLQHKIEQHEWLEIRELLEDFLKHLDSKRSIDVALYLGYQFLPFFEHYVPQAGWCRTVFSCIRKNEALTDIVFSEVNITFSNYDLELAIENYREGIVFLSYAYEFSNNDDRFYRKLSFSILLLVYAISTEFEATRYPRKWEITRNEDGVLERSASVRAIEVEKFKASVWRNTLELLLD